MCQELKNTSNTDCVYLSAAVRRPNIDYYIWLGTSIDWLLVLKFWLIFGTSLFYQFNARHVISTEGWQMMTRDLWTVPWQMAVNGLHTKQIIQVSLTSYWVYQLRWPALVHWNGRYVGIPGFVAICAFIFVRTMLFVFNNTCFYI